uniref:Uncharacterized protein n=1 Tax=Branchiostoma floridae TaxID=7739 RepID=C3YSQ4_BRAFL|eukprot:XP_002600743.1 hypothetical protein BRAFLDRAFT_83486 [Branchiostoma floridae]
MIVLPTVETTPQTTTVTALPLQMPLSTKILLLNYDPVSTSNGFRTSRYVMHLRDVRDVPIDVINRTLNRRFSPGVHENAHLLQLLYPSRIVFAGKRPIFLAEEGFEDFARKARSNENDEKSWWWRGILMGAMAVTAVGAIVARS